MDVSQVLQLLLHFDQHLGSLIAQHQFAIYAMLFFVVFLEIGVLPLFFFPGDPLLFICGAFCATHALNLWLILPLLFAATIFGSLLNYAIGHRVGDKVYAMNARWLDRDALQKTHDFYERYGRITFLLSPFIAVVRTFAPFVAGVARMTFGSYLAAVTLGAAVWVMTLVPGGYFFGNIPLIRDHMGTIVLAGLALGLGGLAVSGMMRAARNARAAGPD